jgi:hypothetical protein
LVSRVSVAFSSPSLSIAEESGLGGGHLDRSALVTAIVFGGLIKWSEQVLQLHRQGECSPFTTITEKWNRAGAVNRTALKFLPSSTPMYHHRSATRSSASSDTCMFEPVIGDIFHSRDCFFTAIELDLRLAIVSGLEGENEHRSHFM